MTSDYKASPRKAFPPPPLPGRRSHRVLVFVISLAVFGLVALVGSRILLWQPFSTPSSSMAPTLVNGDYFVASKFAYGYSRFSLPFLPAFSGRVFASEPQRGDVAVFRLPRDLSTDYVKRIVGLPGDRIQMRDGVLIINDVPVKRERAGDFIDDDGLHARQWRITLPGGVTYLALDLQDNGPLDNTDVYTVPQGHFFALGDNLDNSTDSRVPSDRGGVGFVPFDNLVGRAEFIALSMRKDGELRSERTGLTVR